MSTRRLILAGALLVSAVGCGVTQMRGGNVVPRGQEPTGRVLMRYEPVGCVDRAGQDTATGFGNVWLVRVADGEDVLVSTTPGYDSVVIDNEFVVGAERVFQLSIEGDHRGDVLVDYRLPVVGEGPGRLALAQTWREVRGQQPEVRAYFEQAVVVCRLEPGDPAAGLKAGFEVDMRHLVR